MSRSSRASSFHLPAQSELTGPLLSPVLTALLVSGDHFAVSFATLFSPMGSEYDIIGKNPQAEQTIKNIGQYRTLMEELRTALSPEIELIDSRVVLPAKDLTEIVKKIRKTITKRDHKVSPDRTSSRRDRS